MSGGVLFRRKCVFNSLITTPYYITEYVCFATTKEQCMCSIIFKLVLIPRHDTFLIYNALDTVAYSK